MKDLFLARRPDDLNINWAQSVIALYGGSAKVANIDIISVDVGTTTRVRLNIEHDGPDHIPKRWFVKLPSLNWRARLITSLPRLLQMEIRFYQEISLDIPVDRPAILAARSRLGRGSTLVLADVTELGAQPGFTDDVLSIEQAQQVIRNLAVLHAHFWNKAHLNPDYHWLHGPVRRIEDLLGTALAVPLMKKGLIEAGERVPAALHKPALRYARHRQQAMRHLSSGPLTLVHHDCHPGNLFWKNSLPGFLDWQLVRIGEGIGDIAYFLATALEPKVRRQHEMSFLKMYCDSLKEHGVHELEFEKILQKYRSHLVYPFEAMLVTLAVGGLMDRSSNLELVRRSALALEDHDAFSSLPV